MNDGRIKLEQLVAKLEPTAVARFLVRQGFKKRGAEEGTAEAYQGTHGQLLILPTDQNLKDYTRRLCELVEMFVSDGRTINDVLALIVLPDSDILRYRIETPDTIWGHLRLGYGYEAMHALYDVLKYSAAGVSTQKADYTNVSGDAQTYANQCRFGQTELGSYVLKVYCPVTPVLPIEPDAEPFGRLSTRSTVENFAFVASEKSQDPSQPLPPTLNRQVAAAIHRLKPDSAFGTSVLSVSFSPSLATQPEPDAPAPGDGEQLVLDLGPLIYGRAQSIRDRLKKAEEFGRELVVGYITDLHKDRPTVIAQSRQISLEVKYGPSYRKVTMRLMPSQYRRAVLWHDNEEKVRLDAVFDKRGRPWSVTELFDFSPLDKTAAEATLFDVPPDPPTEGGSR